MKYDGSNPLHAQGARKQLDALIGKGALFDLREESPKRTLPQNRYLFYALRFWADRLGGTVFQAEDAYKEINSDLYAEYKEEEFAGVKLHHIKHTYELDKADMSLSIDRLRNYAAAYERNPVYIPSPQEHKMVQYMIMNIERNKEFL